MTARNYQLEKPLDARPCRELPPEMPERDRERKLLALRPELPLPRRLAKDQLRFHREKTRATRALVMATSDEATCAAEMPDVGKKEEDFNFSWILHLMSFEM